MMGIHGDAIRLGVGDGRHGSISDLDIRRKMRASLLPACSSQTYVLPYCVSAYFSRHPKRTPKRDRRNTSNSNSSHKKRAMSPSPTKAYS